MKQEVKDIAVGLAYNTPTSVAAWFSSINWTTALAVLLGVLQVMYLLRKWWREETEFGKRMKRWAEGRFTKPGDLS
jgi:uncharacterized protein HemY